MENVHNKEIHDSSLEIRAFIGNVIENELKTIMLAESDDFLFRVVQKPHFPEVKDSPLRTLICLYFAVAGFFGYRFGDVFFMDDQLGVLDFPIRVGGFFIPRFAI